jgi:nicotinamide-nucleotide amidase
LRLATAESCTGGLVAAAVTGVPGASKVLERGWVTYSNRAKAEELGVSAGILERHGAVSAETAAAMAEGARLNAGADAALAVTGIAGPDGGSPEKPVGTVWFAVATPARTRTDRRVFPGDRAAVRAAAVRHGLALLLAEG